MKDIFKAVRTSRTLDDHRGRSRWQAPASQARVDQTLSDHRAVPWEEPPRQLHDRILDAIEHASAGGAPMELASRRLGWARIALAAGLVLACGVGVTVALRHTSSPKPTTDSTKVIALAAPESTTAPAFAFNPEPLVSLPGRTQPVVTSASQPMLNEAAAIGEDTRRAVAGVFSVIPVHFGGPGR